MNHQNNVEHQRLVAADAENVFNVKSKGIPSRPIQRVPLGEKRLQLNRSSTNIKTGDTKRRLAPHMPTLSRANSSLGFTHRKDENDAEKEATETKNAKEEMLLELSSIPVLTRKRPLEEDVTDSLPKRVRESLPPLNQTIESTTSEKTKTLHASNIVNRDLHVNNVDPVKRTKTKLPLRESTDEVETIPDHPEVEPYVPNGIEPIEDWGFFAKGGSSRDGPLLKAPIENVDFDEEVGLTNDELKDLLD